MPLVRLLGPVDVVDAAGVVHTPNSPIRCTLLALLALDAGHVIDAEQLLDQAYNGHPPDSGLRALRFHISRLRAELCTPGLITTVGSGYQLDADTDIALVQHALDTNHTTNADDLAPLLALWRGHPLTGCSSTTALEHEQHRLAELRLTLAERHYQQRLDTGDATIIGDLTRLCLDHPERESLWVILITAHYHAGHQVQALRTYDQLRRHLHDHLGVTPSPTLQQLEHHILDHQLADPTPVAPGNGSRSNNLPRRRRELIGRDTDLEHLLELTHTHQLVTITGTGGIGKTSLALAAAHRLAQQPDHEIWWCDLAPADPDDVAFRAGQAIGLTTGTRDPDTIGQALAMRRTTWLILDNAEHVTHHVAELANAILQHANTHIIATSRMALPLLDDVDLSLSSLDPDTTAAQMFVELLDGTGPVDLDRVRSICRRLDGIPLAIELTAARTRALSLDDIDRRLGRLLESPPVVRHIDARHATMSASIQTSVELLTPSTAAALGQLAVFEGGFDLGAADAVLVDDVDDTTHVIEELVAHSLLTADITCRPTRYRLLEPIRQHAAEHLWPNPERTRDRHLEHYLDRLEAAYEILGTSSCQPILTLMDHDVDNLTGVHNWALQSGRIDDDLRLYRPLGPLCFTQEWSAPHDWADETIRLDGLEEHCGWGSAVCVAQVSALARFDFAESERLGNWAASIPPDDTAYDYYLSNAGWWANMMVDDFDRATELTEASDRGDPNMRFRRYYFGSLIPIFAAEASEAADRDAAARESIAIVEDGLRWTRDIGAANFEAALLQQLAQMLLRSGRAAEAMPVAAQAVELGRKTGATWAEQAGSCHLVEAAILGFGTADKIAPMLHRALETGIRRGVAPRLGYVLKTASRPLAASGEHRLAALCFSVPTLGDFDALPRLALDDIPPEVWERAAAEAERLSIFEIARRAADALREIVGASEVDRP